MLLVVLDWAAGASFLAVAVAAWPRSRRYAAVAALVAVAWFAGDLIGALLLIHRPLAMLAALGYPDGRVRAWPARVVLAVSATGALIPSLGVHPAFVLTTAALLGVEAVRWGLSRRPPTTATSAQATAIVGLSLAGPAAVRLWWPLAAGPDALIAIYSGLILLAGLVLLAAPLLRPAGLLTDAVIELPDGTPEQTLAALTREAAATRDSAERDALASAATLLASNAALQAELAGKADEVRASRARLLEAEVNEQQRLEHQLRDGTLTYLDELIGVLRATRDSSAGAALEEAVRTRDDLLQLAQGLHPRTLAESGLAAALAELIERGPARTTMRAPDHRLPAPVEAALWYACAEALANVAKHARAVTASVEVRATGGDAIAVIRDDGVGGARVTPDGGLAGLADRLAAVGGEVAVRPVATGGTEVEVRVPLP